MTTPTNTAPGKTWPDYRAIWRWHFYAGLFSVPFVIVLAITGSIYLFRPQIEPWIDRPYDHLAVTGSPATAAAQVGAALAAVPGSTLRAYELPTAPDAAARVIVSLKDEAIRVYVHPETLEVLHTIREDDRFMRIIFTIHGELRMGEQGSWLVELAASWALILLVTGLYLWWPRQSQGLAGIVYPRLDGGQRLFWRDLHAVTGVWISSFAIFMLLTGLPWAKFWGDYFKEVRKLTGTAVAQQDWGRGKPPGSIEHGGRPAGGGEHAEHMAAAVEMAPPPDYTPLDIMVATVAPLNLAPPMLISPPAKDGTAWSAKSDAANRPKRVNLTLDGATGAIMKRENFSDRHIIDRVVGTGIAAHEGQLFGWPNQLLGLLTAAGLVLLSVSAVIMWWRRRPEGVLGAPEPLQPSRFSFGLGLLILLFGVYLPLFGLSMIVVTLIERLVLRRIPAARDWLGLNPPAAAS